MAKIGRLTGRKEFAAVYTEGRSWSNSLVALRALPNNLGSNRYGFAVGKRLGGAVDRNKVRRRLREAVRHTPVKEGWDIVLVARQNAAAADYDTLKKATEELLARAQLLGNREGKA
jgi:ribonuclease P protein component